MHPKRILEIIRTPLETIPGTAIVPINGGFRVHSNTSACHTDVRMVSGGLTVLIPIKHAATLVEPITRPPDGSPAYTKFRGDALHWNPTTGKDGTTVLKLRRGLCRVSYTMAERVGRVVGQVFQRDAELQALAERDAALMEVLAGAAMELADEFQAAYGSN